MAGRQCACHGNDMTARSSVGKAGVGCGLLSSMPTDELVCSDLFVAHRPSAYRQYNTIGDPDASAEHSLACPGAARPDSEVRGGAPLPAGYRGLCATPCDRHRIPHALQFERHAGSGNHHQRVLAAGNHRDADARGCTPARSERRQRGGPVQDRRVALPASRASAGCALARRSGGQRTRRCSPRQSRAGSQPQRRGPVGVRAGALPS